MKDRLSLYGMTFSF